MISLVIISIILISSNNLNHNFKGYYNSSLYSHPKALYRGIESTEKVIIPFLTYDKQKLISNGEVKFYEDHQDFRFSRPVNTRNILRNKYQDDLNKKNPGKYPKVNTCLINGDCSKINKDNE